MSDYLDVLSKFVAETRYEDISPEGVTAVKDVTLDTLGAIIAGNRLTENVAFAQLVAQRSGPATSTIFGHNLKAESMLATMVNATAGVALEVDEGNGFGGGHPAIHVLPGAMAVAEEIGAGGQQLIESILVGYEVESRIGGATRTRENVHSHGHWGAIGTAVAVAKLHSFDARQIRSVINLAASMSPANTWTPAFKGTTIRNLYPGRSGLQGVLAVHLYECGFTGLNDAPADVFGSIIGDYFDHDEAVKGLGGEYRVEQNYFKFYACCRGNHASLDAVFSARSENDFAQEDVESVDIVAPSMLDGMLGEYPESMLGAKFHVPFAVAAAIVRDRADVTSFYSDAINDGRIRELANKVTVRVDPKMVTGTREGQGNTKVSIRLKDGRLVQGVTSTIRGDYGNRVPRQEVMDKFRSLNDEILGSERALEVMGKIDRLEQLDDVREVTGLLNG